MVQVRDLTSADAAAIAAWRYPDGYSTYDVTDSSDLASDHWAVTDGEELVGYCCFGAPARVAGAEPEPGTLDVGYGMRPQLMGLGHGAGFVAAVLEFARRRHDPQRLRLYVLDWNERSRTVAAAHGFAVVAALDGDEDGERYLVMVRRDRA
ncbi:MAG: [ribosomal protein S18]-alanine N-acetyltransferase [Solirubrobacteraceae bacterium]|nr:[ribosomal protein S18]-alanine N-acetyltransferase [Solirubrobacteraceae bacterium]